MAGLRGAWVVTALLICGTIQGGGVQFDIQQDTTSSADPSQWYVAESHWTDICRYIDCWQGPSDLHVVDVFGASRAISKTFARRHYRAAAWDIKLSGEMDATTESGWYSLLDLCLRMLPGALLAAGPPCSLFVWLCCSVHRRHQLGVRGDESNVKVKLSNYITENLAVCIRALWKVKQFEVMIEQPRSSVMFSLPQWQQLGSELGFQSVHTYMGSFGHFMEKPSCLIGNMENLIWLQRNLKGKKLQAMKRQVQAARAKLEKKLGRKLVLVRKCSKGGGVSGGPDLALSAAYTSKFCIALFKAWFRTWVLRHASGLSDLE